MHASKQVFRLEQQLVFGVHAQHALPSIVLCGWTNTLTLQLSTLHYHRNITVQHSGWVARPSIERSLVLFLSSAYYSWNQVTSLYNTHMTWIWISTNVCCSHTTYQSKKDVFLVAREGLPGFCKPNAKHRFIAWRSWLCSVGLNTNKYLETLAQDIWS